MTSARLHEAVRVLRVLIEGDVLVTRELADGSLHEELDVRVNLFGNDAG